MRQQRGMPLDDDRIVPYLQMAGLYHLARLNETWFRLDEPLVSGFVGRWGPKPHTFHLRLPIDDSQYVSGCLTDFEQNIESGCPAYVWFEELLGVLPPGNCIDKFTMKCTWMQDTFSELP
ncbi:hypothetical protein Ahy_B03g067267 isoform A [Arachis hypogaea]|uniref:Aminotransferase-like plant mobile domain-containing protein n=1 Tax=Arachis hypogaea TaxID=3818 RepID=A0A445A697_ARAHY|nr:hypothetical protein Ahy_B03g067267 isoform A [Arachis hypogaea]